MFYLSKIEVLDSVDSIGNLRHNVAEEEIKMLLKFPGDKQGQHEQAPIHP